MLAWWIIRDNPLLFVWIRWLTLQVWCVLVRFLPFSFSTIHSALMLLFLHRISSILCWGSIWLPFLHRVYSIAFWCSITNLCNLFNLSFLRRRCRRCSSKGNAFFLCAQWNLVLAFIVLLCSYCRCSNYFSYRFQVSQQLISDWRKHQA